MSERERLSKLAEQLAPTKTVIPALDKLDAAVLPDVQRYTPSQPWMAPAEHAHSTELVPAPTDKLTRLTGKALDMMGQILDTPFDPTEPRMVTAQQNAAAAIINMQIKVNDTELRKQQTDILPRLLEMMRREEKQLPALGPLVEVAPA